jgi:hypothetical protein
LEGSAERRLSRRFTMALPLTLRVAGLPEEMQAETRDVSFRGLYFVADSGLEVGAHIDFVLTLPKKITMATDVRILCAGSVVRVEQRDHQTGMAAQIERYEFLPQV